MWPQSSFCSFESATQHVFTVAVFVFLQSFRIVVHRQTDKTVFGLYSDSSFLPLHYMLVCQRILSKHGLLVARHNHCHNHNDSFGWISVHAHWTEGDSIVHGTQSRLVAMAATHKREHRCFLIEGDGNNVRQQASIEVSEETSFCRLFAADECAGLFAWSWKAKRQETPKLEVQGNDKRIGASLGSSLLVFQEVAPFVFLVMQRSPLTVSNNKFLYYVQRDCFWTEATTKQRFVLALGSPWISHFPAECVRRFGSKWTLLFWVGLAIEHSAGWTRAEPSTWPSWIHNCLTSIQQRIFPNWGGGRNCSFLTENLRCVIPRRQDFAVLFRVRGEVAPNFVRLMFCKV